MQHRQAFEPAADRGEDGLEFRGGGEHVAAGGEQGIGAAGDAAQRIAVAAHRQGAVPVELRLRGGEAVGGRGTDGGARREAVEILADGAAGLAQRIGGFLAVAPDDPGPLGGLGFFEVNQQRALLSRRQAQRIELRREAGQLARRGFGLLGKVRFQPAAAGDHAAQGEVGRGLAQRLGPLGFQRGHCPVARRRQPILGQPVAARRFHGGIEAGVQRIELRLESGDGLGGQLLDGSLGGKEAVDPFL